MSIDLKGELLIIGAGGFGAMAASTADDMNVVSVQRDHTPHWEVVGYADCDTRKRGTCHAGRVVLGTIEEVAADVKGRELYFFCAIGDNRARATIVRRAEQLGWKPATLVHPSAIVASDVKIGAGTYIGPAAVVSCHARVGAHVIIDMHASIGHDVVVKDFCAIFPGARVTGRCRLEGYVLVGSNATLLPGTTVGDRAVVGASSLAHGFVEPDTTIFGVPARIIQRRPNPLSPRPARQAS